MCAVCVQIKSHALYFIYNTRLAAKVTKSFSQFSLDVTKNVSNLKWRWNELLWGLAANWTVRLKWGMALHFIQQQQKQRAALDRTVETAKKKNTVSANNWTELMASNVIRIRNEVLFDVRCALHTTAPYWRAVTLRCVHGKKSINNKFVSFVSVDLSRYMPLDSVSATFATRHDIQRDNHKKKTKQMKKDNNKKKCQL